MVRDYLLWLVMVWSIMLMDDQLWLVRVSYG